MGFLLLPLFVPGTLIDTKDLSSIIETQTFGSSVDGSGTSTLHANVEHIQAALRHLCSN